MRPQDFLYTKLKDVTWRISVPNELVTSKEAVDNFAIEFAEWCIESEGKDYNKYKYRNRKELLEIYKKEKGL